MTIDGKEFLKINKDYGNEIISTPQGVEIMKVEYQYYEVPNPARNNTNDPHRYNYPATIRRGYAIVKFLPFETVFETDMGMVRLYEVMFKDGVIDSEGKLIEDKAKSLASKVHKNVSGNRPQIMVVY